MSARSCTGRYAVVLAGAAVLLAAAPGRAAPRGEASASAAVGRIGSAKGLWVLLGGAAKDDLAVELARAGEMMLYVQSPQPEEIRAVRTAAEASGLLGKRIFAEQGPWRHIRLADNLADAILADPEAIEPGAAGRDELLRVLRPGGKALLGRDTLVKPAPEGLDWWTHPYHGPDNNPLSADRVARAPYLTQFLAEPLWGCQPQVTVTAGGRVFRAFGHMAFRAYQNSAINTLLAMSSYNGTLLWRRQLRPGFMIHRNSMIATPETLYLADDESCKLIDAATGELKGQIAPPKELAGGAVWKWMALDGGVLHALLGPEEITADPVPGQGTRVSGWPWSMWRGYDYKDPNTAWGFGRAFLAIDPRSGKVLWSRREEGFVDGRAVAMHGGRIFYYSPAMSLSCLNASNGQVEWKTTDAELLKAIGPHGRAQIAKFGFATSVYLKCNAEVLLFAGPQRPNLVAVSARDGKLLWQKEGGNYQLVLRPEALYAMGIPKSLKLDYRTGEVLAEVQGRVNCTRATGSVDSIFVRGGGTRRIDITTGSHPVEHITPMRPACHDGVLVSDGLLHWGPWICGCSLCLFGNVCLAPAGEFDPRRPAGGPVPFEPGEGDWKQANEPAAPTGDWPTYLHDNRRSHATGTDVPARTARRWEFKPPGAAVPTAPVVAYGLVFVGGADGVVRALDAGSGAVRWKAYTAGTVRFPPAVAQGRAYVGSYDGRVYAYEAATGRLLWRFRAAPAERKIPVYGTLASTWPVAGGVAVEDGVVYAAAGIAHYDGTHVYALDAVTGQVKWHNGSSGRLDPTIHNGVSLQGNVYLEEGTVCFPGGNLYAKAAYDKNDGKYVPQQAKAGRVIFHPRVASEPLEDAGPQPSRSGNPAYSFPTPLGRIDIAGGSVSLWPARKPQESEEGKPKAKWFLNGSASYRAAVLTPGKLLLAQATDGPKAAGVVSAVALGDGALLWKHSLPARPITHGLAVDHQGSVYVSVEDGRVLCFAARTEGGER